MSVPARCNRRACQARRNLSKPPEQYARWPTCHVLGCGGKMYVDKYRLRKGEHDNAPVCYDACLYEWAREHDPHNRYALRGDAPHRVSDKRCRRYEDWALERSLARSKHSPVKPEDSEEAPF